MLPLNPYRIRRGERGTYLKPLPLPDGFVNLVRAVVEVSV
jgi:hypothetical protein